MRIVFVGDRSRNEAHALRPGDTPIGRGVDSVLGIRLDGDPRLSRQHAVFRVDGQRVRVVNESKHGTKRNGIDVNDAVLTDGDVIQLGDTFAVFRMMSPDAVDAPVKSMVGVSQGVAKLRSTVRLVGPTKASVLLLGPTGAGKDVMARAIHDESGRRGEFVAVNTTAIPDSLAESQLFGHVAGSFTGAKSDHAGFFRQAEGGTLFLDEVGDLPLAIQPKLLRVLDERRVQPVGATQPIAVDVRVIAATNADLEARVREGKFRADLYARLAEMTVHLPPLSSRREDVLPLLEHALPKPHPPLEAALVAALLNYPWPYNVREVVKVATELSVRGQGREMLTLEMVEDRLRAPSEVMTPSLAPAEPKAARDAADTKAARDAVPDKEQLLELLKKHNNVIADVARATSRSRKQVYRWLDKYGLRALVAASNTANDLDDET